jgi:hypothetical protein
MVKEVLGGHTWIVPPYTDEESADLGRRLRRGPMR